LKVSDRILVSSRESKGSEIIGQISLQYADSRRNTKEATPEEFDIATNGPNIATFNWVVKEAMDLWSSIFRGDSEVMDKIKNTEKKTPLH
jgi:hypothetical protein